MKFLASVVAVFALWTWVWWSAGAGIARAQEEVEAEGTPPTVEALADGALCWQPTRARDRAWLVELSRIVLEETARVERPFVSRAADPYLLMALTFREASWRPDVIGNHQEVGLMQVHGRALRGVAREDALDPRVNVRLGLRHLQLARAICGPGSTVEQWLGLYGSGRACEGSAGARLALRYSREMQECNEETGGAGPGAEGKAPHGAPGLVSAGQAGQ